MYTCIYVNGYRNNNAKSHFIVVVCSMSKNSYIFCTDICVQVVTICVVTCVINTSIRNIAFYPECLRLYHTEIKTQDFILKLKSLGLQSLDLGSLWRYGSSVSLNFAPGGVPTHSKLQLYASGEEDFLTGEIYFSFPKRPERLSGLPSLLFSWYHCSFIDGKAAGA